MGEAMTGVAGDVNSLYYNPAGLRFSQHKEILSGYTQLFGLSDLSYQYFGASVPTEKFGAWGFSFSQFGPTIFREQDFSLTHSVFLSRRAAVGYSLKHSALKLRRYGSASALGLDLGFLGQIHPKLHAGFAFRNANQPTFTGAPEGPAQLMRAGLAFRPTGGFLTSLDAVKPVDGELSWRVGEEVQLAKILTLRFGIETAPSRYSAGVGFRFKIVRLDYAFISHPFLGAEHHASLGLGFGPSEPIIVAEPIKKAKKKKEKKGKMSDPEQERVNLNTAGLEELMRLPGVGRVSAQNILDYRKEHGPFRDVLDLLKVPRFQRRIFIRVRPFVHVDGAGSELPAAAPAPVTPRREPPAEEEPEEEEEEFLPPPVRTPPPAAPPMELPAVPAVPVPAPEPEMDQEESPERELGLRPMRGRLNVNYGSESDLQRMGFTPRQARNIVRYRDRQGRFDSVDDLLRVPGVTPRDLDAVRDGLTAE